MCVSVCDEPWAYLIKSTLCKRKKKESSPIVANLFIIMHTKHSINQLFRLLFLNKSG